MFLRHLSNQTVKGEEKMKEMKKTKKLNKNSNVMKNTIRAYACACETHGCNESWQDYGMRVNTRGAGRQV